MPRFFIDGITNEKQAFITGEDARHISRSLRMKKEDAIDHAAGIILEKKTGDLVHKGEVIAYLHTNREETLPEAESRFLSALTWSDTAPETKKLIFGTVK